ncbi:MAG TPA: amidase [Ktedonobacterales bacterium]|nr:amidase [Ktedonobacterales bacterium]
MSTTGIQTLTQLSATELAARIARGDVSSVDAVEAHIARIEQVNPALNAVVVTRYDEARAEARQADERRARGEPLPPLHGVPITIKECLDLAGYPSTYGLQSRATIPVERDDPYVARMRQAGAIILGKTNVAQVLLYIESDNPVYGRTNNPWNVGRTPGGSSGGQAAIIAAGGSPLGLATDIGGSIRVPATFCGVAGLKPTAGRTPDPGRFSMPIGERAIVSQVGLLAREVDDVALGLEIINGSANPPVEPPMPLGDPATVDVSGLRVAYYADDGTLAGAPAVRRAVVEAAGILAGQGARVTEWRPPDVPQAMDIFFGVLSADGGRGAKDAMRGSKKDPRIAQLVFLAGQSRLTLSALAGLLRLAGQRSSAAMLRSFGHADTLHYWRLIEAQMAYQERFARALDTDDGGPFDVIICPACALPAFPHGASKDLVVAGGYAVLYNVLGYPTGVVPFTRVRPGEESTRKRSADAMLKAARAAEQGSAGLPIGVQVVARPWREHVALAAMRTIQQAARLHEDYPNIAPV